MSCEVTQAVDKMIKALEKQNPEFKSTQKQRDWFTSLLISTQMNKTTNRILKSAEYIDTHNKKYEQIQNLVDNDPEQVLEVMRDLEKGDRVILSPSHSKHLDSIVKLFVDQSKQFIPEINVKLNQEAEKNGGHFYTKEKTIYLNKASQAQQSQLDKSIKEVYAHEIVHAATDYAIESRSPEIAGSVLRMKKLMLRAQKVLTWEDFMPEHSLYDRKADEREAKALYDYIFNNERGTGLSEFIAHATTNERVMRALDDRVKIYGATQARPETLTQQVMNLVQAVLEWILQNVRKEKGIAASKLAMKLSLDIARANNRLVLHSKRSVLEKAFAKLDESNAVASNLITGIIDKIAKREIAVLPDDATKFKKLQYLLKNLPTMLAQEDQRPTVRKVIIDTFGLAPEGFLMDLYTTFTKPDALRRTLEQFGLMSNKIDQERQHKEDVMKRILLELFEDEKPSQVELRAMGATLLDLDMSALLDSHTIEQIRSYLVDETILTSKITEIESRLGELEPQDRIFYINQTRDLGYYLATHKGKKGLMLNAANIANKIAFDGYQRQAPEQTIKLIDQLATLYGIKYATTDAKQITTSMLDKSPTAVEALMQYHRAAKEEAALKVFEGKYDPNIIKGYTKEIYDSNVTIEIKPLADRQEMEDQGFALKRILTKDEGDRSEVQMAVYVHEEYLTHAYDRYGMRLTTRTNRGTTVTDLYNQNNQPNGFRKAMTNISNLNKEMQKHYKVQQHSLLPEPNKRPDAMTPIVNKAGKVTNFRYMMNKADKAILLNRDTNVVLQLGRMFASTYDKMETPTMNKEMVRMAYNDYISAKNKSEYVTVGPNADRSIYKETWAIIPEDTRNYIKEVFGEDGIKIRGDLLFHYFGAREISALDNSVFKRLPVQMQNALRLAEHIWVWVVQISKVDIVIKTPAVVIGNIISNSIYSVILGVNPIKMFQQQFEAVEQLNKYQEWHRELTALQYKQQAGFKVDQARMNTLKQAMDKSAVQPLIKAGLFQAIIEDVEMEGITQQSKLERRIKQAKETLPGYVQQGADVLYMTDKTSIFKLLMKATQYSDFVARYSLYYHYKDTTNWSEQTLRERVLDPFINYDIPDSQVLRYANKIGLVMFTKYLMRIQRVLRDGAMERPVSFLLAILGQEAISIDLDDPLDQSLPDKNFGSTFVMGSGHIYNMLMPSLYEMGDEYVF